MSLDITAGNQGYLTLYRQGGWTDVSNYERLRFWHSATGAIIGTERAGSGATNSMPLFFQTDGANRWVINQDGNIIPTAHNTYSIGSSAVRPILYGSSISAGLTITAGSTITASSSIEAASGGIGYLQYRSRWRMTGTKDGVMSLVQYADTTKNVYHLAFGTEDITNAAINTTNLGILQITHGADLAGTNTVGGAKFDIISKTNIIYGTTTITNLVADYVQTNLAQGTNLVFYLDMSQAYQKLVITNTSTTGITINTTNRPADGVVRTVRLRIQQTVTNSVTLAFNDGWTNFVGSLPPTSLASNVWGILSLDCDGASETNVLAGYAVQPF